MRRVFPAGLLALPAILLASPAVHAQYPAGCPVPAAPGVTNPFANCSYLGCGGFCFRLFPGLHQNGPLFNYGPYYGYYPFEPYGPWTADLKYNGPLGPGYGGGDCGGCGKCGKCRGGLGWHKHEETAGCGEWGCYAKKTLHNVGHRVKPFGHKCSTCGDHAAAEDVISEPTAKAAPAAASVTEAPVVQAGYPRRER